MTVKPLDMEKNQLQENGIQENQITEIQAAEIQKRLNDGEAVRLKSYGAEQTFELGRLLGRSGRQGQIFTLIGDLGVGKTVFTQGFAAGLGIEEPVSSPTFTILQIYEEGRLPFYHFDVYRIADVEEMKEIGYEDCFYGEGVCLIEWANLIEEILPAQYTKVMIERKPEKGFDYREITVSRNGVI